jgi:thioredoxin 1
METRVDDSNFQQEVINSNMPVLVDFWAEWCMPCIMLAPAIEEIAKEYAGKIKVCKLNVDEAPDTASRYRIMSIPTIMVFKGGEVVDKAIGMMPKEALENFIKPHIEDSILS